MSHPPLWRWRSPRPASDNTSAATIVSWVVSPSASLAAPGDEGGAQFRFTSEVTVQRRLRDAEIFRHIWVAEAVQAATLNEALGDVEDHRARVTAATAGCCTYRHLAINLRRSNLYLTY
jgi:hypothetical protein